MKEYRNSKKQGDAGLGIAIGWFSENEYTVSIPLTDSQDYDLIVDLEGALQRVQVKTTSHKTQYGRFKVQLSVKGGNKSGTGKVKEFDPTQVEYLFVVTSDKQKYLIPSSNIPGKKALVLGSKYEAFRL